MSNDHHAAALAAARNYNDKLVVTCDPNPPLGQPWASTGHDYRPARIGMDSAWWQCQVCGHLTPVEPCIHDGVFAGSTNDPVYCPSCNREVPVSEL